MRIKKSSGLIALICTLISISWLFFKKELSLSTISDALFLWALFFLIIGGFLWVFAAGFFDHFQYSMKKAFSKNKTDYLKLSDVGKQSYGFWLWPGIFLLLLSLLFLLINTL